MLNAVDFNYFGKPRHLKFDINAMGDFEREMKLSVMAAMSAERFGLDATRVLLWAGLKHEDQSLTPYKIGNWIQKYIIDNEAGLIEALTLFQKPILDAMRLSKIFGDIKTEDEELGNVGAEEA